MKRTITAIVVLVIILGMVWMKYRPNAKESTAITIGVVQTVSHPSLDLAREGFIDELNSDLHGEIKFIVHNAEGSITRLREIINEYHISSNVNAIYAIASPAAEMVIEAEGVKPVFVSAVTDSSTLDVQKNNVCGTSDLVNIPKEVELVLTMLPKVERIGILFNPKEKSSSVMVERFEEEFNLWDIGVELFEVEKISQVTTSIQKASELNLDGLVIPNDNFLATVMPLLALEAKEKKLPLFACDPSSVKEGALAAQGIDYYLNGVEAAKLARQILIAGARPYQFEILSNQEERLYINTDTMNVLGLKLPEGIGTLVELSSNN